MGTRFEREVGVEATEAELAAVDAVVRGEATGAQAAAVRGLVDRCASSGRCMFDVWDEWTCGHCGMDELGCPMFCAVPDPRGVL